ncbi:hypothetical protein Solca_2971 [Solitalea canadensis DSM 3403]|uniref:Porin n=1 Tax=Solitalea canadensis (strain ATCC 29591 / DSM 3403 / JCM 21819 / LMG 8368 / NBRC 15130 / NCIMB 12057 / USAM 9D) TaxID=929556 RepID=H8KNJ2_SOLCM|nr:hypothetical protein Solca_2971 [Solitalea canadensis DSM 3403]
MLFSVVAKGQIVNPNDPARDPFGRDTITKKPAKEEKLQDFFTRKDSVKKFYAKSIRFAEPRQFDLDTIAFSRLDTSIHNFQNYSPLYAKNNYYLSIGNLGLASRAMYPGFGNRIGFNDGQTALSLYEFRPERVNYYRVYSPYTDVTWISGLGKESSINFIHTQNIKPNLNIGVEYESIGSQGYYPRQRPKHNLFSAWSWYQSRNLKYNILGNVLFNSLKSPENGGETNATLFTEPTNKQHEFESVYLNNSLTTWSNMSLYLKQSYVVGARDTNAVYQAKAFKSPYSKVTNTIQYDQRDYKFDYSGENDEVSPTAYFGKVYYLDSLHAADRIKQKHFRTDLDLSLYGRGRAERFTLGGGIAYESINYTQFVQDSMQVFARNTNNVLLKGRIGLSIASNVDLDVRGHYIFAGYNIGDVSLDGVATVSMGKVGNIYLRALLQNVEPGIIFTKNRSNFHRYDNSFSKINSNLLSFTYENKLTRTRLSAEYNLINNYTYFYRATPQSETIAQQTGDLISILRIKADQTINFGHFGWSGSFTYQANNAKDILPAPDFYTYQSVYYQNKLFKALDFQIGLDVRYFTKFKSMGYAPELGQFYVGNGMMEVGNYPIADLFITAGLRRTRFLIKYDYLNQGLNKKGYYIVDKYAMPDATFKFGVGWRFYD